MIRPRHAVALVLSAVMLLAISGCGGGEEKPALEPTVAPPVIATEGVLKAGVDMSYPPFAGKENGSEVGIDIDVAAALAERLGLTLEVVDLKLADIPDALQKDQVDIALGAMPITDAVLAGLTPAGSYLVNGPAFFSVVASGAPVPEIAVANLGGMKVGCQKESASYWKLRSDFGEGFAVDFDSLRDALDALVAGEVDVVVADAAVAAYVARDYDDVTFTGVYGQPASYGVSVASEAVELETAVREALDALSSEGVLEAIRTKWLGALPSLLTSGTVEPVAP